MKIKIKDLPSDFQLVGCKLNGKIIASGWNKGFWVKTTEESQQRIPVLFKDFDEIKNWVIEVPKGCAVGLKKGGC